MGLLCAFSNKVWDAVFAGDIPGSFVTNTMRLFKRLNKHLVDEFIDIVKGKGLGCRDLEVLAKAWVEGDRGIREQIKSGNLHWTAKNLKNESKKEEKFSSNKLSNDDSFIVNNFIMTEKYINNLLSKSTNSRQVTNDYRKQAAIVAERILRMLDRFSDLLEKTIEDGR